MQLTVWTYEGPPHVGAMRVATAMKNLHYVLHAPQGDTYADLLFTMIERRNARPPVTYTTFEARDLGSDTAEIFKRAARDSYERFSPDAMIVGASCTAELIQDDPGGLAKALALPVPVIPLELPSYQRKENWGASETFYQLTRTLVKRDAPKRSGETGRPTCNILGPTALGFRHRDDVKEISTLLTAMGVDINVIAPLNATPTDITRLGAADFNVVLYPEIADTAARWLKRELKQPFTTTVPIGVGATHDFIAEVCTLTGIDQTSFQVDGGNFPWWSRSIDSNYLTGKRVFIFGDATHAIAAARVAAEEFAFDVVGLGCYNREFARDLRAAAEKYGVEPLITDDYLEVEEKIAEAQPELVLGTQMERHIAKRLNLPCAVISAPVHVQDFPARYAPQMGFEGANVLFDTWVHPLVMGLEEHLLGMFRDDFEFNDEAGASHLSGHGAAAPETAKATAEPETGASNIIQWAPEAEKELKKIPFFVRGKARRNTEAFAAEQKLELISVDTLYDAKAHYGR
ncbi:MAG: ferredoxin:protochlorophyllide reductase (ATP-dependent) subunit B [Pseudomonadota bacterium]